MTEQFPPFGYPSTEAAAVAVPKAGRRRRTALIAGACAIILAIAGVAAYLAWPGSSGSPVLAATFDLPGHGILNSASFSTDGKLLALVDDEGAGAKMIIWDTVTRTYRATLTMPSMPAAIGFSADDTQVTVIDIDGAVLRWNLATGTRAVVTPGKATLNSVLSGDGGILATQDAAQDGTDVWDLRTGHLIADLTDPDAQPIYSVALDGDGQTLAATGVSHIYIWNVANRKVIATLPYPPGARTPAALLSADGADVALSSGDGTATDTLWDVATRASVTPLDARWPRKFANLYLAVAGPVCATQESFESLDLWNIATRSRIRTVGGPGHPSGYLFAVGPGGHEVLTTPHIRAQNQVATLWDVP